MERTALTLTLDSAMIPFATASSKALPKYLRVNEHRPPEGIMDLSYVSFDPNPTFPGIAI